MTRSYRIVLIFLEGRVLMAIPALARHGMDAINWNAVKIHRMRLRGAAPT